MKNRFLLILAAAFSLTSCYEDYIIDFDRQAVGFANQTDVRSVIVGESMEFRTGIALGGVIDNNEDRTVYFEMDGSLVNASTLSQMQSHPLSYIASLTKGISELKPLPAGEYNLVPEGKAAGKVIIRKGTHLGEIKVKVDPEKFLTDVTRTTPRFVIPLRITGADGVEVLSGRETSVIGVRYENMLFGHYWHGGKAEREENATGAKSTVTYYTSIPQSDNLVWHLSTVAPYSLTANAVGGEMNGAGAQMKLTLNDDGTVAVGAVPGAKYVVEQDGECFYNKAKLLQDRRIYLKYRYDDGTYTYHATDTLTFRNRVRDGVNEWQDENQENYR